MAAAKKSASAKKLAALKDKMQDLAARSPRPRALPPLSPAEAAALEKDLGVALPADYRAFLTEISRGDAYDDSGVPGLLPPREGMKELAPEDARRAFPASPEDGVRLAERVRKLRAGEAAPAVASPMHGVLPLRNQGDATYDCVILAGPLAGTMWQSWDSGITPLVPKKGKPAPQAFLDFIEEQIDESVAALPPPILPDAKQVGLGGRKLGTVPPAVFAARGLERLDILGNDLTELPDATGELTALRELLLSNNRLTRLGAWIGKLANLKMLVLDGNLFEALPDELCALAALEVLRAQKNRLTVLPARLGELASLTELVVSDNALAALPESIGALARLRKLDFARNPLRALPASFARLPLAALDLDALPALDLAVAVRVVAQMPALTSLKIARAPLASADALAPLAGSKTLTTLRLVNVSLRAVPDVVAELPALASLGLDQNEIMSLPEKVLALPALKSVALFANGFPAEELARLRAAHPGIDFSA